MAGASKIEWTDDTWNPIVGCSIKSPGCKRCYAMRTAWRLSHNPATPHYAGTAEMTKAGPVFTGKVAQASEQTLTEPMRWKKPRRIFVNSMGDLFHESIPDEWIDRVFAVMALCPQHVFQVLTKRAERMRRYMTTADDEKLGLPKGEGERRHHIMVETFGIREVLSEGRSLLSHSDEECCIQKYRWPLPNVWLGVSTERQQEADERIPLLLQTPAAVRFISAEPLLGAIDLRFIPLPYFRSEVPGPANPPECLNALSGWCQLPSGRGRTRRYDAKLDWVIVGGESGPKARPMSLQWARELRDQCAAARVSFFFKQWGCWAPAGLHGSEEPGRFAFGDYEHDRSAMIEVDHYPRQFTKFGARSVMQWFGKKAAGRLLDGKEHNEFPAPAARSQAA